MDSRKMSLYFAYLVALMVSAGCGGGGAGAENAGSGATAQSVSSSAATSVATGSAELSTALSTGEGMAYLYQTGYVLDTITISKPESTTNKSYKFTTDTDANTIRYAGKGTVFIQIKYDEQGRVTEFGRTAVASKSGRGNKVVSYNDDGTIAKLSVDHRTGNKFGHTEFNYVNSQNLSVDHTMSTNGVEKTTNLNKHHYSEEGYLSGSQNFKPQTNELHDSGRIDYTVNDRGLVVSIRHRTVTKFDIKTKPYALHNTITYDEHDNILRIDSFSEKEEVIRTVEFTYSPSTEPTPNMVGFMVAVEPKFRQLFMDR